VKTNKRIPFDIASATLSAWFLLAAATLSAAQVPPPVEPAPAVPAAPYGRYLLQPSDTISIAYRYSPEYDFTGPVQPDGFISPPLLGEIMVAGITLEQARSRILDKARVRLRDPEIYVVLKDFEKPQFAVGGEVDKPGRFELRGRIGVLEAIAMAGGFKTSAKHSQVVLFRRYDDEHVITRVLNVKEMQKHASELSNIELHAGDFVMVPKSKFSKVERIIPYVSLGLLNPYVWR